MQGVFLTAGGSVGEGSPVIKRVYTLTGSSYLEGRPIMKRVTKKVLKPNLRQRISGYMYHRCPSCPHTLREFMKESLSYLRCFLHVLGKNELTLALCHSKNAQHNQQVGPGPVWMEFCCYVRHARACALTHACALTNARAQKLKSSNVQG